MRLKLFVLSGLALSIAALTPLSAQTAADASVLDAVSAQTDLKTLASIAAQTGVGAALNGPAVTLFAPSDEAFGKLAEDVKAAIQASPDSEKAFIAAHTLTTNVTEEALKTASSLTTASGKSLSVKYDAASNTFQLNDTKIVRVIAAKNGTIFVIADALASK